MSFFAFFTSPFLPSSLAMIQYRLDDLGWYQFEWLCQSLLKVQFGVQVQAWGGHSDLGRDAYCEDPLEFPKTGQEDPGPFLFQAKFVSGANAAGATPGPALSSAVSAECGSIKRRIKNRLVTPPRHYVLMTNVPLTPKLRADVTTRLEKAIPGCKAHAWGAVDICAMLNATPAVRMAFPQILGLGDLNVLLEAVLAKKIVQRSTLRIERAAELPQVFFPTEAYAKAMAILARHSFVVLTGPPEMGKTTIARVIGLAKLADGWDCYECMKPDDLLQMFNRERPQVFIADDAFGSTEFRPDIAHAWAADLDSILRSLDDKHWLIWTSRPAPLKIALQKIHLQGQAEKFPQPGEVIVDAHDLTVEEKALILYRHAKAASLSIKHRNFVKKYARTIVANPHFTPERCRRFVRERLATLCDKAAQNEGDNAEQIAASIAEELTEPTVAMKKSFGALDKAHQDFLISLLDGNSESVAVEDAIAAFKRHSDGTADPSQIADDLAAHFIRKIGE